jgi:hypothetical protein
MFHIEIITELQQAENNKTRRNDTVHIVLFVVVVFLALQRIGLYFPQHGSGV